MSQKGILAAAVVAVGLCAASPAADASSASDWPNRAVTVIVPWSAGGGTDPLARLIFGEMAESLDQPFPIDFRPGAAGTVGTAAFVKTPADGYTILFTSSSPAVNAVFRPNMQYDPRKDLIGVAQVTYAPTYMTATAGLPLDTFQEVIDYAKANPGKINAGVSGVGGNSHLSAMLIQHKTGVKFNIVPYGGSGAQRADLMAGTLDLGFGFATGFLPGVKAGKMKYIAALAKERSPFLPDVAASDESKYKGIYRGNWFMAFLPGGTPDDIVQKINEEINKTVHKPEIKEKIEALNYSVVTGTPADAEVLIKEDIEQFGDLVEAGVVSFKK